MNDGHWKKLLSFWKMEQLFDKANFYCFYRVHFIYTQYNIYLFWIPLIYFSFTLEEYNFNNITKTILPATGDVIDWRTFF